jgi:hypothetical protein
MILKSSSDKKIRRMLKNYCQLSEMIMPVIGGIMFAQCRQTWGKANISGVIAQTV